MSIKRNLLKRKKFQSDTTFKAYTVSRYAVLHKILVAQSEDIDTRDLEYVLLETEKKDKITRRYTQYIQLSSELAKKYFYHNIDVAYSD